MQKVSNITIRVDNDLKKQAIDLFDYFGLTLSQAITLFLKQSVNSESIPFEIKKPKYSQELLEAIEESEEMTKHPEKYKSYSSTREMLEDIKNDESI